MKLRDESQKTGHLLAFISKTDREDNFSFFFPVEGLAQFDSLLMIAKGFEHCAASLRDTYDIIGYSIANAARLEDAFPEVDKSRMLRFELDEFITEDTQFCEDFAKVVLERQAQREFPLFPDIVTGAMATGANFYDRSNAIKIIRDNIEKGNNLLLRAPRRYGKTSLLYHLFRNPSPGWCICYVDLEGGKSSEDFVEQILKGLIKKKESNVCLPEHLSMLEVWKKREGWKKEIVRDERKKIRKNWKSYLEAKFESMNSAKDRFLIILDEVSFLLEDMICAGDQGIDKVGELMEWFHGIRKDTKKLSFILSGSEHLPSFLEANGIDGRLDDLEPLHLGLFDGQVAREFIFLALAGQKIVVRPAEIEQILTLIGEPIPYFLQLFLDTLGRICRETSGLSFDEIEAVYYQELLGSGSKRYFESIRQQVYRYDRYGERNRAGAESLLDELAVNNFVDRRELEAIWQEATGSKKQFDVMLSILRDDFYVKEENYSVFITSKLLKNWWERHALAGKR
jgi:hypothetical protein